LRLIWKNKANLWKAEMSVSIYMKGYYDDFGGFGRGKNKPNSKPILFSPQIYLGVENPIWKNKPNFRMGEMMLIK